MRLVLVSLLCASAAVALAACYDNDDVLGSDTDLADAADASGGSGDAGSDAADGSADPGPVFTPCADNLDCRGGEVCRGGFCREACSDGDPCIGDLRACDPELGFCVECNVDPDCPANYRCLDQACSFYCVSDAGCGAGTVCDLDSGACIEPDCTADSECPGGFACRDFTCAPIDEPICAADTQRCEGDVVVGCSRDGTVETRTNCDVGAVCVYTGDTTATCRPVVCTPSTSGCSDTNTRFSCDSTGTLLDEADCAAGEFCTDGFCATQACAPNATRCEGDTLAVCDALGSAESFIACDDTVDCVGSAFGCYCADGDCSARVCDPGTLRCVGPGYQACSPEGSTWGTVQSCPSGQSCSAGACR